MSSASGPSAPKMRPCRPSESQGMSDPGPPERSSVSGGSRRRGRQVLDGEARVERCDQDSSAEPAHREEEYGGQDHQPRWPARPGDPSAVPAGRRACGSPSSAPRPAATSSHEHEHPDDRDDHERPEAVGLLVDESRGLALPAHAREPGRPAAGPRRPPRGCATAALTDDGPPGRRTRARPRPRPHPARSPWRR